MIRTGHLPSVTTSRRGDARYLELALAGCEILTYVIEGTLVEAGAESLRAGEFERRGADGRERRRFCAGERRGALRVIAHHAPPASPSPSGPLRLARDATIYSALLAPGQHVAHALAPGRRAWVHVVRGDVALGERGLHDGDGACVEEECVVSLTAHRSAEILLVDLPREERIP